MTTVPQATIAFLKALTDAPEDQLFQRFEGFGVPRFDQKLAGLTQLIPVDQYILALTPQRTPTITQPLAKIKPRDFDSPSIVCPPDTALELAWFISDELTGNTGCTEITALIRKFADQTGIQIYVANPPLVVPRQAKPRASTMKPAAAFCTFATEASLKECLLCVHSIRLFHPDTPIVVVGDWVVTQQMAKHFPDVQHWAGATNDDVIKRRSAWERRREKANDPFHGLMSFKMDAIGFAMMEHENAVYVDADMIFLDQFPDLPDCDFAAAMHGYDPKADLDWDKACGSYNAGLVYCASRPFLKWWKEAYMLDKLVFTDQALLNEAAVRFDMHLLPANVNFGQWRLWNHIGGMSCDLVTADGPKLCDFAGVTVDYGIRLHGRPLQSIHVHTFSEPENRPNNAALKRLLVYALGRSQRQEHQELFGYYQSLLKGGGAR